MLSNLLPSFLYPRTEEQAANRVWRESVKAASGIRRDSEGEGGAASAVGVAASATALTAAATTLGNDPKTGTMGGQQSKHEKERKIGHRRVGEGGEITYKKIQTSQIMGSIQLGIQHTVSVKGRRIIRSYLTNCFILQVGSLASKPKRDLLMMDFWEIETISFPPEGSSITPAHHFSEFRFKIYAPIAFRYFRDLFGIQPDDFMVSHTLSGMTD